MKNIYTVVQSLKICTKYLNICKNWFNVNQYDSNTCIQNRLLKCSSLVKTFVDISCMAALQKHTKKGNPIAFYTGCLTVCERL